MSTPGWGGYRQPTNPAPVSGPGAMSARTDGGVMNPNSPGYGDVAALEQLKSAAPVAAASGPSPAPAQGGNPLASIVGLGAPSQRPGEPVTAGAALGAGPGADALGLPRTPRQMAQADVQALGPGAVNAMIANATRDGATPSFKALVRAIVFS